MMTLTIMNLDDSNSSPFIDDVSICPTQSTCAPVVNGGFEADQHGNACVVPRGRLVSTSPVLALVQYLLVLLHCTGNCVTMSYTCHAYLCNTVGNDTL